MIDEPPSELLSFDRIEIGKEYAYQKYSISDELIRAYASCVGAKIEETSEGCLLAPSSLPVIWTPPRICIGSERIPVGGIHTRQVWRSYRRCKSGDTLTLRVVAAEKALKKARKFVTFRSTFENQNGERVGDGEMSIIWPQ